MPRRALRCVVDLNIDRVSAPGVWLPSKEDVYLSISLFGQYRNTRNVCSVFPLPFYEPFRFEKTYYTALDPQDVAEFLDDELVVIELLQYSDYSDGAIRLASYSTSAREFLFPYPSLCPSYTSASREILLSRTIAWPGISPKLEFSTATVIKESRSPELDALEDALEEEKMARRARSRSRSRTQSRSLSRSRSRTRTCSGDGVCVTISRSSSRVRNSGDLSDTEGANKAPFVVRHLDDRLIGRKPGAPALKTKKGKKKKGKKSSSRPSSALSGYDSWEEDNYDGVIRDGDDALPVYTTKYISDDDDDLEVADLTSRPRSVSPPRPRSASPYIYKPSYSSRFSRPLSPSISAADRIEIELAIERARARARAREAAISAADRVEIELAIERARARARARARELALSRSPSPVRSYSPLRSSLRTSLEDLAIDTSIVKNRRYYPTYL